MKKSNMKLKLCHIKRERLTTYPSPHLTSPLSRLTNCNVNPQFAITYTKKQYATAQENYLANSSIMSTMPTIIVNNC